MKIREWSKKYGFTMRSIAHELGITPEYLSSFGRRGMYPSERIAKDIVHLTSGEVSYEEIRPINAPKPGNPFHFVRHPLKKWMEAHNLQESQFAKRLGITPTLFYDIINSRKKPSESISKEISKITQEEIQYVNGKFIKVSPPLTNT